MVKCIYFLHSFVSMKQKKITKKEEPFIMPSPEERYRLYCTVDIMKVLDDVDKSTRNWKRGKPETYK